MGLSGKHAASQQDRAFSRAAIRGETALMAAYPAFIDTVCQQLAPSLLWQDELEAISRVADGAER